ncbi:MAG: MBOAT family protein [Tannerellaceae bacterium]|nr:MBOAT family protein [Tannerellaceae bacterium]
MMKQTINMHTLTDYLHTIQNWLTTDFSLDTLGDILVYQPSAPMLFSSGLFFFLFIGFVLLYVLLRKHLLARLIYVTLFSLYFYYKSSGIWFVLLLFTATTDFCIGQGIIRTASQWGRKLWVTLSLCLNLGMLAYFKYYNFLVQLIVGLLNDLGYHFRNPALEQVTFHPADIFLPVGISFFTFQSLSYIIDIYRGRIEPLTRWIDYVFYVSFFPQLVAGPIVRARDFIPQIYKPLTVSRAEFSEGLFLILCGLFKKSVISDYISLNFVDRIFDAPLLYTGVENLLGVYGYALQIYCDFSGYSDTAIGIALLLGYRFNINFDSPYQSATITEFWRRWHISLSSWLKDYLYISLGGNRKGRVRTYLNLLITMLLGGLWHGASMSFVLWGALHGTSLAIHKFIMAHFSSFKPLGSEMNPFRRVLGILFTFHLVCLGWILFRTGSMQVIGEMLTQIFTNFHPEVFLQFVVGYKGVVVGYKGVFILMVIGYIFHFMPRKVENGLQQVVTRSPLVVQALMLILAIFVVVQFKSAGVQPFIYFQF